MFTTKNTYNLQNNIASISLLEMHIDDLETKRISYAENNMHISAFEEA